MHPAACPSTSACGIALLAGGQSRRMGGQPKACLEVGDRSLLQRVLDACQPLELPIWLVRAADPPPALVDLLNQAGFEQLVDRWPDAGPLGGLATAFEATSCQRLLLLACDLPFLSDGFLNWLLTQGSPRDRIVVLADGSHLHPLCALYDRSCYGDLQMAVNGGRLRAHDFIAGQSGVRIIPRARWLDASQDKDVLMNINTTEELETARRRLAH